MYHQFKELADVDITAEPMEIGPTCHYVMGGVEVDADTELSGVTGLYSVGECSGGMHGSNRLGGNSLSDLLVFGRRAGESAAAYAAGLGASRPAIAEADVKAAEKSALAPFDSTGGENPYTIQQDLQQTMNDLVGIIRTADELTGRSRGSRVSRSAPAGSWSRVTGSTTPAGTWPSTCATCCWSRSRSPRRRWRARSRAADTPATTSPGPNPEWGAKNLVVSLAEDGESVALNPQPLPPMPDDLQKFFE